MKSLSESCVSFMQYTLKMEYEAVSDQDTLINITNHSYFNLSAGKR